jgi:hypothetical protein
MPSSKAISDSRDAREGARTSSEFPAFLPLKTKQEFFSFFGCRYKYKTNFFRVFVYLNFKQDKLHLSEFFFYIFSYNLIQRILDLVQ